MLRYYCDNCGKELQRNDHNRIKRKLDQISVEVMTAVSDTWNSGQVCHKCVINTILKGNVIK